MTTRRQRQILVLAVGVVTNGLDDETKYPFEDATWDDLEGYDDRKIGGENRNRLARCLREVRRRPQFLATLRKEIANYRRRIARQPSDYGLTTKTSRKRNRQGGIDPKGWPRRTNKRARLYPKTVTRRARQAVSHQDCNYCGSFASGKICGECKEAGIDGPVIRGTEARQEVTYTMWS